MVTEDMKKCNCSEPLCCCGRLVVRSARANVSQDQSVFQLSNNLHVATIAIATNGGTAKSSQQTCQSNGILRSSAAIATSCTTLTCDDICDDSAVTFSASDQQDRQDVQTNFSASIVNSAIAGAEETEIARSCSQQPNSVNEIRTTMATSCPPLMATQPDNLNQEDINAQYRASENLDSVLNQTPLSSIKINGKAIPINSQNQIPTIKQVAFDANNSDEDNTNEKPLVLSFDKFHVILNLDGISLDATVDSDGNVLVDRKGVRR